MKLHKRHGLWAASVAVLALFSFLVGNSFACFQKGAESIKLAEDCCKGHCQHVMAADMAAKCCQSHQAKVSQVLPAPSSAKAASLAADTLPVSLIPPVVLPDPEQSWVHLSTGERPPPSPPFYTLYCTLLI